MVTIRYERGTDGRGGRIIETDTGSVYRLVESMSETAEEPTDLYVFGDEGGNTYVEP